MNYLRPPEANSAFLLWEQSQSTWTCLLSDIPEHTFWAKEALSEIPQPLALAAVRSLSGEVLRCLTSSRECDGQIGARNGVALWGARQSPVNHTTKAFNWPAYSQQ